MPLVLLQTKRSSQPCSSIRDIHSSVSDCIDSLTVNLERGAHREVLKIYRLVFVVEQSKQESSCFEPKCLPLPTSGQAKLIISVNMRAFSAFPFRGPGGLGPRRNVQRHASGSSSSGSSANLQVALLLT